MNNDNKKATAEERTAVRAIIEYNNGDKEILNKAVIMETRDISDDKEEIHYAFIKCNKQDLVDFVYSTINLGKKLGLFNEDEE